MRGILEVLRDFRHPVTVVTKGALIERDADILGEMGRAGPGARPGSRSPPSTAQLARAHGAARGGAGAAARRDPPLADAGCPVRVMIGAGDPRAQRPRDRGAARGGPRRRRGRRGYVVLRLPREVGAAVPRLAGRGTIPTAPRKVMGQVREMHGGRDYDPQWGKRMKGEGVRRRADRPPLRRRRGRGSGSTRPIPPLRTDLFRVPTTGPEQLALF